MKVAVIAVGDTKVSSYTGGNTQRITFEVLEEHSQRYVYLNLDRTYKDTYGNRVADKWLPFMKAGNVLDVNLQKGSNKNVNIYGPFQVRQEVNKERN